MENHPVIYQNHFVATTEMVARWLKVDSNRIKKNFQNNRTKYQEGKHFFLLKDQDLRDFKNKGKNIHLVPRQTRHLYLWTEKGFLYHVKSIGTDEAWQVYETLVDTYFRQRQALTQIKTVVTQERLQEEFKLPRNIIRQEVLDRHFADDIYDMEPRIAVIQLLFALERLSDRNKLNEAEIASLARYYSRIEETNLRFLGRQSQLRSMA